MSGPMVPAPMMATRRGSVGSSRLAGGSLSSPRCSGARWRQGGHCGPALRAASGAPRRGASGVGSPQCDLVGLVGRGLGQLLARTATGPAICSGPAVRGNAPAVVSASGCGAGTQHHMGHQYFAAVGIGPADHRCVDDVGVREQHLLDLARVDVVAADDHHVLLAIADRTGSRRRRTRRCRRCRASRRAAPARFPRAGCGSRASPAGRGRGSRRISPVGSTCVPVSASTICDLGQRHRHAHRCRA